MQVLQVLFGSVILVLQILWIGFTSWNCVWLTNLRRNLRNKPIESRTYPYLVTVITNACVLIFVHKPSQLCWLPAHFYFYFLNWNYLFRDWTQQVEDFRRNRKFWIFWGATWGCEITRPGSYPPPVKVHRGRFKIPNEASSTIQKW